MNQPHAEEVSPQELSLKERLGKIIAAQEAILERVRLVRNGEGDGFESPSKSTVLVCSTAHEHHTDVNDNDVSSPKPTKPSIELDDRSTDSSSMEDEYYIKDTPDMEKPRSHSEPFKAVTGVSPTILQVRTNPKFGMPSQPLIMSQVLHQLGKESAEAADEDKKATPLKSTGFTGASGLTGSFGSAPMSTSSSSGRRRSSMMNSFGVTKKLEVGKKEDQQVEEEGPPNPTDSPQTRPVVSKLQLKNRPGQPVAKTSARREPTSARRQAGSMVIGKRRTQAVPTGARQGWDFSKRLEELENIRSLNAEAKERHALQHDQLRAGRKSGSLGASLTSKDSSPPRASSLRTNPANVRKVIQGGGGPTRTVGSPKEPPKRFAFRGGAPGSSAAARATPTPTATTTAQRPTATRVPTSTSTHTRTATKSAPVPARKVPPKPSTTATNTLRSVKPVASPARKTAPAPQPAVKKSTGPPVPKLNLPGSAPAPKRVVRTNTTATSVKAVPRPATTNGVHPPPAVAVARRATMGASTTSVPANRFTRSNTIASGATLRQAPAAPAPTVAKKERVPVPWVGVGNVHDSKLNAKERPTPLNRPRTVGPSSQCPAGTATNQRK